MSLLTKNPILACLILIHTRICATPDTYTGGITHSQNLPIELWLKILKFLENPFIDLLKTGISKKLVTIKELFTSYNLISIGPPFVCGFCVNVSAKSYRMGICGDCCRVLIYKQVSSERNYDKQASKERNYDILCMPFIKLGCEYSMFHRKYYDIDISYYHYNLREFADACDSLGIFKGIQSHTNK